MLSDLRFAVRRLRAAPLFALFAVLTLGLGIGVTTATYSALYRTFWRPLGIAGNESVYWVAHDAFAVKAGRSMSSQDLADLRAAQTSFLSLEATASFPGALFGNGRPAIISGEAVSGGYFSTLGVRPMIGRLIQPSDDDASAPAVAVISERLWRTHFAADREAVGKPVKIGGRPFELVGVAQAKFDGIIGITPITDVWVPVGFVESVFSRLKGYPSSSSRTRTWVKAFGRLAPGQSAAAAVAQLQTIGARLDEAHPILYRGAGGAQTKYPRRWTAGRVGDRHRPFDLQMIRALLMVPALILLIACTNLTNLMLSRGSSRAHEFAVRRALGCSRFQLVRDQVIEVGILAVAGSLVGIATARVLLQMLDAMITEMVGFWPRFRMDFSLEPSILAAVGGAALLALLVSGLAPALELTREKRSRALGVDSPGWAPPKWRGRSNLIALQVAGSVALFMMSSFFVREIMEDEIAPSGMQLSRTALVNMPFDTAYADESSARAAVDRVLEALRKTPGVETAAAGVLWDRPARLSFARIATPDGRIRPEGYEFIPITGEGFRVLGIPVRSGRAFYPSDSAGAQPVAIVNESFGLFILGMRNVIGRELQVQLMMDRGSDGGPGLRRLTIVGVAPDTYNRRGKPEFKIYVPLAQHFAAEVDFVGRSSSLTDKALATAMRTAILRVAPDVPAGYAGPAVIIEGFANQNVLRIMTIVSVSLASFSLLLATGGLFGVLTHVMAQRRRELGIRAALGADRVRIRNLVLREGIRPVIEGGIIGIGAAGVMGLISQPMFAKQVANVDPLNALLAVVPLLLAAAIACYLPARRASLVDPNVALREL